MKNQPTVFVLTNTRDLAADDVIRRASESHEVVRLNADLLPLGPDWLVKDEVQRRGVVWWRQFESWPTDLLQASEIDDLMVTRAQWRAWISILETAGMPWVNGIWQARRAENKIEQLRIARDCGFSVPDTLVTNQKESAKTFAKSGPSVVKSLSSAYFEFSGDGFVYTHSLEDVLDYSEVEWRSQPVILQQRILGADARVITFDGLSFGAKCETDEVDWRIAGAETKWSPWVVPPHLHSMCSHYMEALGLRYAAFDFILTEEAEWFLEANQAGEWAFLDRSLHLGIAEAFTNFLVTLANAP